MKIAINGFGRIGRALLRAILAQQEQDLVVTCINDLSSGETLAHLLKYDSVHGRLAEDVTYGDGILKVGSHQIKLTSHRDIHHLDWADIDYVCECTGVLGDRQSLMQHLGQGAKRVLVSAPVGENADVMVVYGVNHQPISPRHRIISNASCTTNCLAPVAKVLNDEFGLLDGSMVTVHAYTADQRLVDAAHSDLRRSRAAAISMIPTKTGAAKAIGMIIPELAGKLDGYALRVPTANVSLVDLTCRLQKAPAVDAIKEALKHAAGHQMQGVMAYNDEPLVSCDYNHQSQSATIDALEIRRVGDLYKILAWYDNEWGFVNRMIDVMLYAKV